MSGLARNTDPDTSHEAAKIHTSTLESMVFEALNKHGPMTAEEISQVTGVSLQSITPRIKPLMKIGILVDTGLRKPGASGRNRRVIGVKNV